MRAVRARAAREAREELAGGTLSSLAQGRHGQAPAAHPDREARSRRARSRRQGRRAGAARRRLRGRLPRPAQDAARDRRRGPPGGRRRDRALRCSPEPTSGSRGRCSPSWSAKRSTIPVVVGGDDPRRRTSRSCARLESRRSSRPRRRCRDATGSRAVPPCGGRRSSASTRRGSARSPRARRPARRCPPSRSGPSR